MIINTGFYGAAEIGKDVRAHVAKIDTNLYDTITNRRKNQEFHSVIGVVGTSDNVM